MSQLDIKGLFRSHTDVLMYLEDQKGDENYMKLRQLQTQSKELQQYHAQKFTLSNMFSDADHYNRMVNYVRSYLKRVKCHIYLEVRELNHSLQDEFARSSQIDSRSISTLSVKQVTSRKSKTIEDVVEKFVQAYREAEALNKDLQELFIQFDENDYQSEDDNPSTKDAHKWLDNLDFELKCLLSEIGKLPDPSIRIKARNRVIHEFEHNQPLQVLMRLQQNYVSVKQSFNILNSLIEELIEHKVKEHNIKVDFSQLEGIKSVHPSATSTLRVFSKDTALSVNLMEAKEQTDFQMLIQEMPSYENVLSRSNESMKLLGHRPKVPEDKACCSIF